MKKIIKDKRKELDALIKKEKVEKNFSALSTIILDNFPNRLWKKLSAGEIYEVLKNYTLFILSGPPYSRGEDGLNVSKPKVQVYNPEEEECSRYSLSRETTVAQIHVTNKPFIFESVRGYFTKKGYRLMGSVHPIFTIIIKNDKTKSISGAVNGDEELFINLYIEKITDANEIKDIENDLLAILRCLDFSVEDFVKMKERLENLAREVEKMDAGETRCSAKEVSDFLRWLTADNFVLLGIQDYLHHKKIGGTTALLPVIEKGLGIFREKTLPEKIVPGLLPEIEGILISRAKAQRIMSSDFCNNGGSIIYQLSPVEFFSIRTIDKDRKTAKETLILGRLTRGATHWRSDAIPTLKRKALSVIESIEQGPASFEYREARALFNYLPKQEAFYANIDQLKETIHNIMSAQSDNEVTIHIRLADEGRYAMVMVTISRNDNSFSVRTAIEKLLTHTFKRPIATWHHSSTEARALLFYYFVSPGKEFHDINYLSLEEKINKIAIGWDQQFYLSLYGKAENEAANIYKCYIDSIDAVYKDSTRPERAVSDVLKLEDLFRQGPIQLDLIIDGKGKGVVKLYALSPVPLMKILKKLENFGLYVTGEQAYSFKGIEKRGDAYIFNYILEDKPEKFERLNELLPVFFDAMVAVSEGRCEDDSLNRLLILEGLDWKTIELVRTLKNYLLQINRTYSNASVIETIVKCSSAVNNIFQFFIGRFRPEGVKKKERAKILEVLGAKIQNELADIHNLNNFQVLNTLYEIVKHTVRTNFFITPARDYISVKIVSRNIAEVPSPKPMAEIYVHSPTFEGVHLRGGRVSRGGIRWSDRSEDFRTEVLGLMKTQMLKNSIIVPEGAKGGFIIKKNDFSSEDEQYNYMKDQYSAFISGILDLTDNYSLDKEIHPKRLVIYDEFDPYLVVAADKGTATLSDTANGISAKYGFWLGDAFASGGATGYDHKKEGITARGAWESVKRHFRGMGIDVQKESITVTGIGDMSGDVFGNGMLLSEKIKLVGAFNHKHVFLDPNPDPGKSFKERRRLFNLGRSSWTAYDSNLISKGGGIYLRSAKSVPVSDEMAKYLGTDKKEVTGEEMTRLLLQSKVDLLYNGGIGTYIKATTESHLDVGDKANDSVRINGSQVKAKVICEGGNLGVTQRGRLEYALRRQGKMNTDAIDNSGGVDMSDHEVNIKIMLNHLLEKGEIKNMDKIDERNRLLKEMTDQVSEKVLKNNYLQGAAISMDLLRANRNPELFMATIDEVEKSLDLERTEEFIPTGQEITEAIDKGEVIFTRPMIAVLMGYEKMKYYNDILKSAMVKTFFVQRYLKDYFPEKIKREFEPYIEEHRLKDEIISTVIINKIVSQAGITLLPLMSAFTGKTVAEIAKVYIIIENLLQADKFRADVFALDNIIPSELQYRYLMEIEEIITYALRWFITHQTEERISFDFVLQYTKIVKSFQEELFSCITETCCGMKVSKLEETMKEHVAINVPEELAKTYVTLPYLRDVMDIIRIKEEHHYNFHETARLYLKVRDFFNIDWLGETLSNLKASDKWGNENIANLRHELRDYQNGVVVSVLNFKRKSEDLIEAFDHYIQEKGDEAEEYRQNIEDLRAEGKVGIISLNVLIKKLVRFISHGEAEVL
ncbi:MAG: NAD-glutamate dehydrogenase [Proteobacteria bacterium]|nr:NAD-glutamate dehydrogenase [Pseudomonadota bacterium]